MIELFFMLATLLPTKQPTIPPPSPIEIQKAIDLSKQGDYEGSDRILGKVKRSISPTTDFYKLLNAFMLNRKEEGITWADNIIYAFDEVPQRYIDLATIMKGEMQSWKDDLDDLEDISREMNKISNRLKNNKGGEQTQNMQKKVLDRLAKMIKEREDELKRQQEEQDKKDKEKQIEIEKEIERVIQPPKDTHNQNDSGTGEVERKRKIRELASVWGKLPPKAQAKAIANFTRYLPSKDKAVIEKYLRELMNRSK